MDPREFGPPFEAKPFCAVMAASPQGLADAKLELSAALGPVSQATQIYTVDLFTHYYQGEMGTNLRKQFLVFRDLRPVSTLNQLKFQTADIEDRFRRAGRRTVNLDPGYLTLDKLVLYTTKNFTHRLFLERGLFAEITLVYARNSWRTQTWTYPDYQTPAALHFFTTARKELYKQLKDTGSLPNFSLNNPSTPEKGSVT